MQGARLVQRWDTDAEAVSLCVKNPTSYAAQEALSWRPHWTWRPSHGVHVVQQLLATRLHLCEITAP